MEIVLTMVNQKNGAYNVEHAPFLVNHRGWGCGGMKSHETETGQVHYRFSMKKLS